MSHAVYFIPLCFYLGWSAYLGTMSKRSVWPYHNGYMAGGAASSLGLRVVPVIIYHFNAMSVT